MHEILKLYSTLRVPASLFFIVSTAAKMESGREAAHCLVKSAPRLSSQERRLLSLDLIVYNCADGIITNCLLHITPASGILF